MIDRLKDALAKAESTATGMQIDQIAFIIGSFPTQMWASQDLRFSDYPKIAALLPEMKACSEPEAMLRVAGYMDREDIVGSVSTYIRKTFRS
jgi:hypothetical protein